MPAPDIQYFLDSSLQCLHIAQDTYFHFMYQDPNVNGFIDSYDAANRRYVKRKHWDTLQDMGAYCEEELIRWRGTNPENKIGPSFSVYESLAQQLEEFVGHYAAVAVDRGHTRFDERAQMACHEQFGMYDNLAMIKRACVRSWHDLEGYSKPVLDRALLMLNQEWTERQQDEVIALNELRRQLGVRADDCNIRDRKQAVAYMRRKLKEERKTIKRSINHGNLIMGEETTKMFIGGGKVRVEGKHCVYEITKTGGLLGSHGSASLGVFTKEDDIHLCNLCIYTPNVPVMDHVASLIMHIKAGEEEEILRIGNAFSINQRYAYEQPWLVPHLPERDKHTLFEPDDDLTRVIARHLKNTHGIQPLDRAVRRERLIDMRAPVARMLFDELGRYCPPMELTRIALLSGRDFRTDQNLLQDIETGLEMVLTGRAHQAVADERELEFED